MTIKGNTDLFFSSRFEGRVATAVIDDVTEDSGASVGGVDSADGVGYFDVWIFFVSRFEERVAIADDDASNEATSASVGGVDSAAGVGSFDVGGTTAGSISSAVDDDAAVDAGTFLLNLLSSHCSRRLTVFIFVEVKAIKKYVNIIA